MVRMVDGIDHVIVLVRCERIAEVAEQWRATLGLQFDDLLDERLGLRVLVDLDGGIELIAPLGRFGSHGAFFTDRLDERGEGVQSVVFRTGDLEAAAQHAERGGARMLRRFTPTGSEPYADRYREFVEHALTPIDGVHVTLAHLVKKVPPANEQG